LPCHRSDGVLVRYDPKLVGKHRWSQRYGLGGLAERFDQEQAGRGYKTALSSSESGFRRASSRCSVRRGPWRAGKDLRLTRLSPGPDGHKCCKRPHVPTEMMVLLAEIADRPVLGERRHLPRRRWSRPSPGCARHGRRVRTGRPSCEASPIRGGSARNGSPDQVGWCSQSSDVLPF
jgi:hypothetical protein